MAETIPAPDVNNTWRLKTPGEDGWLRSARPDAEDKFFMVSADGHVQEPKTFLKDRVAEPEVRRRHVIGIEQAQETIEAAVVRTMPLLAAQVPFADAGGCVAAGLEKFGYGDLVGIQPFW